MHHFTLLYFVVFEDIGRKHSNNNMMLVRKFSHSVVLLFLSLFMLYRLQSLTDPLLILLAVLKIWCDQLLAKLPTTAKNHVKDKRALI